MRRTILFLSIWIAGTTGCESMKEYALDKDKQHEGKMTKQALKDFWTFTTDSGSKPEEGGDPDKPRKDVFGMKDVSTKNRPRILVDVDADLTLPVDVLRDKGFRLAQHLMLDTKSQAVKIRFWLRGCHRFGGVFGELTLSSDGLSFEGTSRGADKTFSYVPSSRPWTKLTPDEIKTLQKLDANFSAAEKRGDRKPMDSALRATAEETGRPPTELSSLTKRTAGWFVRPK